MKSCKFEKLLPDYLQDELAVESRHQLEAHLETCEQCAARLEKLVAIHQILSARQRPKPSKELVRDYRNYLKKYFPGKTSPVAIFSKLERRWNLFPHFQKLTLRLAGAFALIIFGVFIGKLVFIPSVEIAKKATLAPIPAYVITPTDLKLMSDYFVKSEILLLAIENWQGDAGTDSSDLLFDKKIAQNL
ncbi:MAG: hypothetical protein GWP06_10935, partial [Actinobacteria bacterium]|nr:hypothetical protein [Actinomycetota bacterium]